MLYNNFCGTQVVKQIKQSLTRHIINEQKIPSGLALITELKAEDICFSEWNFNKHPFGTLWKKLEEFWKHGECSIREKSIYTMR